MKLEIVADRRLHPATFLTRAIKSLPQYALGLPAMVGMVSGSGLRILILIALGGIAAALAGGYLYWRRFRYGVGNREIVIESGIFHRQRRVIPFDRIQDIDIEQGLLSRLFGTAKVKIETGGGSKNEGDLDSVALEEAHRLREILRRGHQAGPAEGQDIVEAPSPIDEPLIFGMDLRRVLLAGLFNFSLIYLAFIFGGLEYLEAWFGIDPWSLDWIGPARSLAAEVSWAATAFAFLVIIILGVVVGILRTIARDYNFRLTRVPGGLRRQRGLFTLSEVVIPFRRVQLAVIQAGLVARYFGWYRLEFQTLNADAARSGHQVAAPFARIEEVLPILGAVHKATMPPDRDYVRVSKRHILRQSLRWLSLGALFILGLSIAWPPGLALLLVLPLGVAAAALQWRHHRYCPTPDAIHVRQGWLTRRLWIVPYEKIQSISVDQGPLQRKLSLASIAIDTAGASLLRAPNIINLPAADAESLAARLMVAHLEARAMLRRRVKTPIS
ncbi:MAG: PH domain-containing protein [Sphingosinicella sp.]|nr:PH domain-containing protein [Sphingosinicella sp.]